MKITKPPFEQIFYERHTIRWGCGNNPVGVHLIATIKLKDNTKKQDKEEKKDYEAAKKIYDEFINVGQRFKPSVVKANREVTAKITFIHVEKQLITWKQDNIHEFEMPTWNDNPLKPACGKWPIDSFIALVKSGEIEFIK